MQEQRAALSSLNFVWIGPPNFKQGGHDVVGVESIARHQPKNPMVFWCQEAYVNEYRIYFKEKGIQIEVKSIDAYLNEAVQEELTSNRLISANSNLNQPKRKSLQAETKEHPPSLDDAVQVSSIYRTLLSEQRNQIVDRVCFKDLFFLFLLSREGGYVLDTNIQAMKDQLPIFSEYDYYHFPVLAGQHVEVWMQYCPLRDRERVQKSLKYYLDQYASEFRPLFFNLSKDYSPKHHALIGEIAIAAVCLKNQDNYIGPDPIRSVNVWKCSDLEGADVRMDELNLFKEYYNSHKENREADYHTAQFHCFMGQPDRLLFDLDHGISPNYKGNSKDKDKTLLHIAMGHVNFNQGDKDYLTRIPDKLNAISVMPA